MGGCFKDRKERTWVEVYDENKYVNRFSQYRDEVMRMKHLPGK